MSVRKSEFIPVAEDVRKFVDAVFHLFPEEAPKMAEMAAARRMGFGETHLDYGSIEGDKY